jgi:hypothetical protein
MLCSIALWMTVEINWTSCVNRGYSSNCRESQEERMPVFSVRLNLLEYLYLGARHAHIDSMFKNNLTDRPRLL